MRIIRQGIILLVGLLGLAFAGSSCAAEQTLSIIKPDAVKHQVIGKIITRLEEGGLKVVAAKRIDLSCDQAEAFYKIHKDRPFFKELVKYMTSGPVFVQVLEGENAIQRNREIMGATDPKKAAAGTIRADFGRSIDSNAVHGSDSLKNAAIEIQFFFPELRAQSDLAIKSIKPTKSTSCK